MAKRPRQEQLEPVAKVSLDRDLLCLICQDLVLGAVQLSCCGSLFCDGCIQDWMNKKGDQANCPSCRTRLDRSKILPDLRSDRQSAQHLRNCAFHDTYDCPFIGNRRQTQDHEPTCDHNPTVCHNQHCFVRKTRSESTITGLKVEIEVLKESKIQDALLYRRQLSLSAWRSAESVIKDTHGLQDVAIFDKKQHGEYELFFEYDGYHFACVVLNQNHNVSIFCRPDGLPCREGRFTMVLTWPGHPEKDACCPIVVPNRDRNDGLGSLSYGKANWLTEAAFEKHFYDGRMALGVRFPALQDYDSQSQGSGGEESEGEWEDRALIQYEDEESGEEDSAEGSSGGSEAGSDESSEVDAGSLRGDVEGHQFPDYEESEVDDDGEEEEEEEEEEEGGEGEEESEESEEEDADAESEEEEEESEWEDGQ